MHFSVFLCCVFVVKELVCQIIGPAAAGSAEYVATPLKTDAWNKHCLQAADAVGRVEMIGAARPVLGT